MANFDNTNTGILSRNDRKEKDTHPDFKGQINIEGREYWLSGWVKTKKDNSGKFFSLSVTPKDSASAPRQTPVKTNTGGIAHIDLDDGADLPFWAID